MAFVHLHNHTEYSLLDGANRIPDLVQHAQEMGMPALAISDHGVMFGVMEFYFECKKRGIKPIIGMEAYMAPNGLHNKQGREENQTYHLLLLAKDLEGYRNLCKLHTVAALQGFYYKPRIDHDLLRQHRSGLIGTSACLGSEICQELMAGRYDKAQYIAGMYKEIFEEGSFLIELQDHRLPEQAAIRPDLLRIARELQLPVVATNDAHYLCRTDHKAHDVLLCIGTGALVQDDKRLRFETEEFYLKSEDEMRELFSDVPEAIENTLLVESMCNVELGKQRADMPEPELPEGESAKSYLEKLAQSGLAERLPCALGEAEERLQYELGVIQQTGFDAYFLLVREFAQYAREQGIAFGVRGSAAGSLVSYCLGITDVDPLEYDLTFERFLNPERVSMPDIDMDFEDARRDEVVQYVTERFGSERVAQIITFGTMAAKGAIRDAGRVLGYTPQETDRICKAIPNLPNMSIERATKESAEFRQVLETDPRAKSLVEVAKTVEGLSRNPGVHAAGIVISQEPLDAHIPLYRGNDGQAVTAYEMGILEKIGLLKFDFLGLSNLTVLSRAVENIRRTQGVEIHLNSIPLDDAKTYEMLGQGETVGVFQLESGGMRRNIIELKPQSVRELAAMVALYRPGPMALIADYVDNKFGRKQAQYLDERMRPVLEETYGIIVYQDQVLKLVQVLAGFSLGKADILRRAMGKKDKEAMASMFEDFRSGCAAHEISAEVAQSVWELLEPFAGYAFNKAHAVCYALIAYQTAYLKANYPVEYLAALLAVYQSREDKVTTFIEEARRQRIVVLPPDVNQSGIDFQIEIATPAKKNGKVKETLGAVRFGLAAIKGVGESLVEAILLERQNGPFNHLYQFAELLRPHGLNKSSLEALIRAGALDSIDKNRNKLLAVLEGALVFADQANRNKLAGQDSLFEDSGAESEGQLEYPHLPEVEAPKRSDLLAMEKEVLGIYVSDHPLRGFDRILHLHQTHPVAALAELEEGTSVKLAGVLASIRTIVTKSKGEKMATAVLEDLSGQAQVTIFPATFARFQHALQKDRVITLAGVVQIRERPGVERTLEVRAESIEELEAPTASEDDESLLGTILLRIQKATRAQLSELRALIERTPGDFEIHLTLGEGEGAVPLQLIRRVDANPFLNEVRRCYTRGQAVLVNRASLN